uniref:Uncharacterized protein n=1 Tax=Arundo donax TaxID=35708 RepID=A0A0A8Y6F3_ARUDO
MLIAVPINKVLFLNNECLLQHQSTFFKTGSANGHEFFNSLDYINAKTEES